MSKITIRECQKAAQPTDKSFTAMVSFDSRTRYDITVRDPFDAKQERDLEFYFEEWIQFPFDEQVRAQRAAASVKDYGERLFEDVFGGRQAYSDYTRACEDGLSELRIEIEGDSPAFQALHWEALKDPDLPRPLAVECVFTRKRFQRGGLRVRPKPSSEINLLVVTARPDEENDVGYRTISRPLIEAIERGRVPVNVELLRPGTFEALSEHLERKEGFYHIVHFDAHGALMNYDQYMAGTQRDRYVFQTRRGRADIEPYEGEKSFLFLEGAQKGQADPVEAQELADLLVKQGIPVCVLNACQSGKQLRAAEGFTADENGEIEARETSLGSRLMAAGMQTVVAMGYSVTVSAAALMMEKLYASLFERKGVPEAIRLGRRELHEQKNRRVYFNQIVALEDWLLPVVYANSEVDFQLEPLQGEARTKALVAKGRRYRFEEPTYGFVGRDLEILKIERALLRHNVLLLQGMGGTGKTTLLNYLRQWWQTTGFVQDVFYFGYDQGAHTLQQMLWVMGKRLCAHRHEFDEFESIPLEAQMMDVVDKLRAESYGLVLDNLESVTGKSLAIENTLPEEERKQIRDFFLRLRGGRTKVLLGSRSDEGWLAEAFTKDGKENVYALRGLDPESRTVLAEKILAATSLKSQQINEIRKDRDFRKLMALLAGYPLAMEVVLANLAQQSPAEVLAALDAADVDLSYVGGEDRTNNILKCVEYSHSNLSADAQKLLVCLAPFSGFIDRVSLKSYGKQLQQLEPFENYAFEQFDKAVQEAIQWGVLSPIDTNKQRLLTVQPVFPYFLRTKLKDMNKMTRNALYGGFKTHYQSMSEIYRKLMNSKDSEERQLGIFFCHLEYENLYNALQISLKRKEQVDIFFCLCDYYDLQSVPGMSHHLCHKVCHNLEQYPKSFLASEHGYQVAFAIERKAKSHLELQQYEQSKEDFQKGNRYTPTA
ncbi:MAG: CHAT domain-containing protein [Cyanobacteria bacterium J06626_6]